MKGGLSSSRCCRFLNKSQCDAVVPVISTKAATKQYSFYQEAANLGDSRQRAVELQQSPALPLSVPLPLPSTTTFSHLLQQSMFSSSPKLLTPSFPDSRTRVFTGSDVVQGSVSLRLETEGKDERRRIKFDDVQAKLRVTMAMYDLLPGSQRRCGR